MYDSLRRFALRILKVPHDPAAPAGDPASLRVFRAGRNYLRLRLAGWAFAQVLALAGIVFWTVFLVAVERSLRASPPGPGPLVAAPAVEGQSTPQRPDRRNTLEKVIQKAAKEAERAASAEKDRGPLRRWYAGYKQFAVEVGRRLPDWAFVWIWVLKVGGILFYFIQLPVTYAVRRLDYEMRWYLVTDRSLRLREGVWSVQETTMSFANLQEVVLSQGPVQRLLGLGDVQVKSAGGGGAAHHPRPGQGQDLHTGRFHCVTNAPEIRDLILERLRRFRDAGLGDPEDGHAARHEPAEHPVGADSDVLAAAREAIREAKALRSAVG